MRAALLAIVILLAGEQLLMTQPVAAADSCSTTGDAQAGYLGVAVECEEPPAQSTNQTASSDADTTYDAYMWRPADAACEGIFCQIESPCEPPSEYWGLWAHFSDGTGWTLLRNECVDPTAVDAPTITPGLVLRELRRVGLPELTVKTNPADKTLVNLPTIFYTDPRTVHRTLTILGQSVVVEATPASYLWHFGDGESTTTDSPGAPYPSRDVTHAYSRARVTMQPSVDTTYTARFRVNGGAWQDVGSTVTVPGPASSLRVAEATPVLSGNR